MLQSIVPHAYNPSIQEAKARWWLWISSQSGLDSKYEACLDYTDKPCLQKNNNNTCIFLCLDKLNLKVFLNLNMREHTYNPSIGVIWDNVSTEDTEKERSWIPNQL